MTNEEFLKGITYLGIAYNKEYTKIEVEQHYDFLKKYSFIVFRNAIDKIIKSSKFLPKISGIIEECETQKRSIQLTTIDYMNSKGYFREYTEHEQKCCPNRPSEYERAKTLVSRGIVPNFLKEAMKRYFQMMVNEKTDYLDNIETRQLVSEENIVDKQSESLEELEYFFRNKSNL